MKNEYVVTLASMGFHTRIGVLPHEAEIAQSIEVDVSVWVSRSGISHGGEGVLDYRQLYDLVSDPGETVNVNEHCTPSPV